MLRDVDMYDVDLTDAVPRRTEVEVRGFGTVSWPRGANAGVVDRLHAAGIVAVCYLDSGAWEAYEPDADLFAPAVIGNSTGWARRALARSAPERAAALRARSSGRGSSSRGGSDATGSSRTRTTRSATAPGFPIGRAATSGPGICEVARQRTRGAGSRWG